MQTTNNKQIFYDDLKRRILTLDLEPGADLDERRLSEEYKISRTPVRDVFHQLSGEGYIEIQNNRGAIVSMMSHKTLRDFFVTAPAIYDVIAQRAADHARPAQINALKDVQFEIRRCIDNNSLEDMAYRNCQFHVVMGEMADNDYLMPSLQRLLLDHARIGQTFYQPQNLQMNERFADACNQHDQFIEAIEAHDSKRAVEISNAHWLLSKKIMDQLVQKISITLKSIS